MKRAIKYSIVTVLFLLLVSIRAFENDLFYDPLIAYFKNDYLYSQMPDVNAQKLLLDVFFRYLVNTIISLLIIYFLFRKKSYLKFAGAFYVLAFVLLISVFAILVSQEFEQGYLLPFYIRRFLIHPLFLLILLPVFYYMKLHVKKKN